MDSIYNHPFPNRSLSTFSYFLKDHLDNKYAFNLVYEELMRFFQRNIIQYDYKSYPVYFMGNLAYTYADILDLVAKDFGLNIEKRKKPYAGTHRISLDLRVKISHYFDLYSYAGSYRQILHIFFL